MSIPSPMININNAKAALLAQQADKVAASYRALSIGQVDTSNYILGIKQPPPSLSEATLKAVAQNESNTSENSRLSNQLITEMLQKDPNLNYTDVAREVNLLTNSQKQEVKTRLANLSKAVQQYESPNVSKADIKSLIDDAVQQILLRNIPSLLQGQAVQQYQNPDFTLSTTATPMGNIHLSGPRGADAYVHMMQQQHPHIEVYDESEELRQKVELQKLKKEVLAEKKDSENNIIVGDQAPPPPPIDAQAFADVGHELTLDDIEKDISSYINKNPAGKMEFVEQPPSDVGVLIQTNPSSEKYTVTDEHGKVLIDSKLTPGLLKLLKAPPKFFEHQHIPAKDYEAYDQIIELVKEAKPSYFNSLANSGKFAGYKNRMAVKKDKERKTAAQKAADERNEFSIRQKRELDEAVNKRRQKLDSPQKIKAEDKSQQPPDDGSSSSTSGQGLKSTKIQFGDLMIDKKKLRKNILSIQNKKGQKLNKFANIKITNNLKSLFTGSKVNTKRIVLTDPEKIFMNRLLDYANVDLAKSKNKVISGVSDDNNHLALTNRMNIIIGEMEAGNNNPELLKELKIITHSLLLSGFITKTQAKQLLNN